MRDTGGLATLGDINSDVFDSKPYSQRCQVFLREKFIGSASSAEWWVRLWQPDRTIRNHNRHSIQTPTSVSIVDQGSVEFEIIPQEDGLLIIVLGLSTLR